MGDEEPEPAMGDEEPLEGLNEESDLVQAWTSESSF